MRSTMRVIGLLLLLFQSCSEAFGPLACRRSAPSPALARRSPAVLLAATAQQPAQADWGGLPGAIKSSKCGAINNKLVKARDVDSILKLVADNYNNMNGVNVATALHHVARLTKFKRAERDSLLRDPRYLKLLDGTIERVGDCNARSVADILWSCATLADFPPTLLKPVLTQVAKYLGTSSFEPQHLGIMVWAFATLGCKPVKLLEQIEAEALEQLAGFNTQNCANILHGFAKLGYPAQRLLPAISDSMVENGLVDACKPVEVADLTFAVAMLGEQQPASTPPLLVRLAGRARLSTDLNSFSSRQLVTMLWAYARLQQRPDEGALAEWTAQVRSAHERTPLLAADLRNCQRALERLGEDTAWLSPDEEEEEEGDKAEVDAAAE